MGYEQWLNGWTAGALGSIIAAAARWAWLRKTGAPSFTARMWGWSISLALAKWERDLLLKAMGIDPTHKSAMQTALSEISAYRAQQKDESPPGSGDSTVSPQPRRRRSDQP